MESCQNRHSVRTPDSVSSGVIGQTSSRKSPVMNAADANHHQRPVCRFIKDRRHSAQSEYRRDIGLSFHRHYAGMAAAAQRNSRAEILQIAGNFTSYWAAEPPSRKRHFRHSAKSGSLPVDTALTLVQRRALGASNSSYGYHPPAAGNRLFGITGVLAQNFGRSMTVFSNLPCSPVIPSHNNFPINNIHTLKITIHKATQDFVRQCLLLNAEQHKTLQPYVMALDNKKCKESPATNKKILLEE